MRGESSLITSEHGRAAAGRPSMGVQGLGATRWRCKVRRGGSSEGGFGPLTRTCCPRSSDQIEVLRRPRLLILAPSRRQCYTGRGAARHRHQQGHCARGARPDEVLGRARARARQMGETRCHLARAASRKRCGAMLACMGEPQGRRAGMLQHVSHFYAGLVGVRRRTGETAKMCAILSTRWCSAGAIRQQCPRAGLGRVEAASLDE